MDLIITVNFPDGKTHDDIETSCADLADLPSAVGKVLLEHQYVTYSSLVIVAVPTAVMAADEAVAA